MWGDGNHALELASSRRGLGEASRLGADEFRFHGGVLGEEAVDLRLLRGKEGFLELGIGFKLEDHTAARVWGKAGGRASLFMICFCSSTISAFFSDVRSRSATCRATHRGGLTERIRL